MKQKHLCDLACGLLIHFFVIWVAGFAWNFGHWNSSNYTMSMEAKRDIPVVGGLRIPTVGPPPFLIPRSLRAWFASPILTWRDITRTQSTRARSWKVQYVGEDRMKPRNFYVMRAGVATMDDDFVFIGNTAQRQQALVLCIAHSEAEAWRLYIAETVHTQTCAHISTHTCTDTHTRTCAVCVRLDQVAFATTLPGQRRPPRRRYGCPPRAGKVSHRRVRRKLLPPERHPLKRLSPCLAIC